MTEISTRSEWQQAEVPDAYAGLRLDIALKKIFGFSRASLQQRIEEGLVCVNGSPEKKRYMVQSGDLLSICPVTPLPSQVSPEPMAFDVLYEDSSLFIINKPPGLVVHPGPGNRAKTFVNGFVAHCSDLTCQDPIRPGLVHRLDKDTSGVLIAAKNPASLAALSEQFHDRTVCKEYIAIVSGQCPEKMECHTPIGRDPKHRQRMAGVADGKSAKTEFFSICSSESWTLIRALPHTGRTHQLRVHLASLGYPILGDFLYGRREVNAKWKGVRQMLHCRSIGFVHPVTKEQLVIQAPLPQDMVEIIKAVFPEKDVSCV